MLLLFVASVRSCLKKKQELWKCMDLLLLFFVTLWKIVALFAEISVFLKHHCAVFQKMVPMDKPAAL